MGKKYQKKKSQTSPVQVESKPTGPDPVSELTWIERQNGRHQIIAALLLVILIGVMIGSQAQKWNPILCQDTLYYYYPPLKDMNEGLTLRRILEPFLMPASNSAPMAHEAKPVFISMLRLWHGVVHFINPEIKFPNHHVYSYFISFTLILLFASCILLGLGFGCLWGGLIVGLLAMVNEWGLPILYFNSYQAITTCFLVLSFIFLYSRFRLPVLAGMFMSLNLMANQSTSVFAVAFAAPLLLPYQSIRERFKTGFLYGVGAAACWAFIEFIVWIMSQIDGANYRPRWRILAAYLGRSNNERVQQIYQEIFTGTYFFNFSLWLCLLFCIAAIFSMWRVKHRKVDIKPLSLLLVCLVTTLLIEVRTGPKFSRTYALVLPFFFAYIFWQGLDIYKYFSHISLNVRRTFAALALMGYLAVAIPGLSNARGAFLDVSEELSQPRQEPIYFFGQDKYLEIFQQILEEQGDRPNRLALINSPCEIQSSRAELVLSPVYKSILNLPNLAPMPIMPEKEEYSGDCNGKKWTAKLRKRMPFFSHYPYLVLDDPDQTTVMIGMKHYTWTSYQDGIGRVTLWDIQFE